MTEAQEIYRKVRQIEIRTRSLSQQLFSGAYHSSFKGRGMSFSEVREYQYGDDIRHIDWNVTARTGQTQVKVFEEERELTLLIMADISRSMHFGSSGSEKRQWQTELAAVLAFSANQNHDKTGLILFSDRIHLYLPPKKGRQHLLRIIRELLVRRSDSGSTDFHLPLQHLSRVQSKRCIAFLMSDFQAPLPEATLRIAARRHELIGLQIRDALERELPDVGLLPLKDLEQGYEMLVDTSKPLWAENYRQACSEYSKSVREQFLRAHADFLELDPGEPFVKTLLGFFKKRK